MAKKRNLYSFEEGNYTYFGEFQGGVIPGIGEGADWNKLTKYEDPISTAISNGYTLTVEMLPSVLTTKGDLATHTGAAQARLAVGTNSKVLKANSSATEGIEWGWLLTTKGDLLAHDGTTDVRKAVGDNGKVLSAKSSETDGLLYVYSVGLFGIMRFGSGVDGPATLGSGTTTLATGTQAVNYTTLTLQSGATLINSAGSTPCLLVIYCSEALIGADATSIIKTALTNFNDNVGSGGAGTAGSGAGGASGAFPSALYVYAKHIQGTGTLLNTGGVGVAGGNGSAPAATANGAAGGASTNSTTLFGCIASWSTTGAGGGGGGSAGTGGIAGVYSGSDGWNLHGMSTVRDMGSWMFGAGANYLSTNPTGTSFRTFIFDNANGSAAGGRNNGGAQGAGGGGSSAGCLPWPLTYQTGQNGAAGGAGAAGGSGSGGGGGGVGGTGGLIYVYALTIASGWFFTANGGAGGNGGNGFGYGGGGASGTGGDGGLVITITVVAHSATVSVAGGAKGTVGAPGASGGSSGNAGSDGRTGYNWAFLSSSS